MHTVEEIQQAIQALSEEDYVRIRKWFADLDYDEWDRQIEEDSTAGRLDHLIADAIDAKEHGLLVDIAADKRG